MTTYKFKCLSQREAMVNSLEFSIKDVGVIHNMTIEPHDPSTGRVAKETTKISSSW
jgi:hypothetical protein